LLDGVLLVTPAPTFRDAYFALGVREVWLADRWNKTVEVCRQRGSGTMARDVLRLHVPSTDVIGSINIDEIFHEL
jgi:hypothetical protein